MSITAVSRLDEAKLRSRLSAALRGYFVERPGIRASLYLQTLCVTWVTCPMLDPLNEPLCDALRRQAAIEEVDTLELLRVILAVGDDGSTA